MNEQLQVFKIRFNFGALAVICALGLALLLPACGGGDGTASGEGTISKAEFVREANAICSKAIEAKAKAVAAYQQRVEKAGQTLDQERTKQLITDIALPPVRLMSKELGDLPIPEQAEKQVAAIVSGYEAAVAETEKEPMSVLNAETSPFAPTSAAAGKFGLSECSRI